MRYSVLIPFRNKPLSTLQHCLEALASQDLKEDFEVIIVNYGSDEVISQSFPFIIAQYPFCQYLYNETRGFFWNQPHALNSALLQAKGQYIIRLDVDMILSPHFLTALHQHLQNACFYHTTCFMLTQKTILPIPLFNTYSLSKQYTIRKAKGVFLVVEREILSKIGGFDEFYFFWGVDDLDTSQRLIQTGLEEIWMDTKEYPILHQWHPHAGANSPTHWYQTMWQYYQTHQKQAKRNPKGFGKIYTFKERPALQETLSESFESNFSFSFPKEASFSSFFKCFYTLESGASLRIRQDFSSIQWSARSKLGRWMKLWNRFFEKMHFSYRWTDIKTFETEWITPQQIKDFLFYFILEFKDEIADYYFDQQGMQITCVVVRK